MGRFINGLNTVLDVVYSILHQISNVVLCIVMLLITFDVFGRFFFNQPITGTFELTELGSAILVFFTLAITHKYKEHVAIGFVIDKLSNKMRNVMEGIIEMFICVVIFLMSWQILNEAFRIMGRNVTTSDLSLPVYPFIIIASIGSFAFAFAALTNGLQHFVKAVEKT